MGCCLDYGCWCLLCFVYCVFDCICDCCGTVSLLGCPGWLVAGFLDSAALGCAAMQVCCVLLGFWWFLGFGICLLVFWFWRYSCG